MIEKQLKDNFKRLFGPAVSFDTLLKDYTTFKTGGPADIFLKVRTVDAAVKALNLACENSLPIFVLGQGSNILVGDRGIRGLVIKNEISRIETNGDRVRVGSGVLLNDFLDYCRQKSLAGIEFMAGIYGTVGGAIAGNAGAYGHAIGEFVLGVTILGKDGALINLTGSELEFSYRNFKVKKETFATLFIAEAEIGLKNGDPDSIASRMADIMTKRNEKMPDPVPSAGCFFKNIEGRSECDGKLSAGKLLEEIGAKSFGGKKVSVHQSHANIVMNLGGANSGEILAFANNLKKMVLEKYGISLEFEVRLVGEF